MISVDPEGGSVPSAVGTQGSQTGIVLQALGANGLCGGFEGALYVMRPLQLEMLKYAYSPDRLIVVMRRC